ncbi:MAG: DUF3466 family protein [Thermoanaerobaculales bacterium]|nr:DUF3466 family protein [Thermoanaerobaculales bacterium]
MWLLSIASPAGAWEVIDLSSAIPGVTDAAAFDISPGGTVVGAVRVAGGEEMVARWSAVGAETLDSPYGAEYAQAISEDGVIVGTFSGTGTGWFFLDGTFDCIPLPDPCGSFNNIWRASSGTDINIHNVFTGAISPAAGQPADDPIEAYLGSIAPDGSVVIHRLGDYLGFDTTGYGLNDHGAVVGVSRVGDVYVPLVFRGGEVLELPALGGDYNWAEAINNDGMAVGIASEPLLGPWPYDAQAVLWDTSVAPFTVTPLGKLAGHRLSRALGVNSSGLVVGFSVDASFSDQRAVAWIDGSIVDLNESLPPTSDWVLEVATAVNDAGEIVGYGRRVSEVGRRAFLMRIPLLFGSDFEEGHPGTWSSVSGGL